MPEIQKIEIASEWEVVKHKDFLFGGYREVCCTEIVKEMEVWLNTQIPLPRSEKFYPCITLTDDILKRKLKRKAFLNVEVAMDLIYMNAYVDDKKYERPANPLLFFAMDVTNGMVIAHEMIMPGDCETDVVLNFILSFIMESGKMSAVYTRNPFIHSVLEDICQYLTIALKGNGEGI